MQVRGQGWIFGVALCLVCLGFLRLPATEADEERTACDEKARARERTEMVRKQIERRGVKDAAVLDAMRSVGRHCFVPPAHARDAYQDHPLPIGTGQTISQPYIVALMTELLAPKPSYKVLEVGTGSGYQAAVLARIVRKVYTIEIFPSLAKQAADRLARLGYKNVEVKAGDGYDGWPEHAPYDAIIVTAAASKVPPPLIRQLKAGGRMCIPVRGAYGVEELIVLTKDKQGTVSRKAVLPVRFVPLLGDH